MPKDLRDVVVPYESDSEEEGDEGDEGDEVDAPELAREDEVPPLDPAPQPVAVGRTNLTPPTPGKKRVACSLCHKVTTNLESHVPYCPGAKPDEAGEFACTFPECPGMYSQYCNLTRHWRQKHGGPIPEEIKALKREVRSRKTCGICGEMYLHLDKHNRSKHPRIVDGAEGGPGKDEAAEMAEGVDDGADDGGDDLERGDEEAAIETDLPNPDDIADAGPSKGKYKFSFVLYFILISVWSFMVTAITVHCFFLFDFFS